MCNCLLNTSGEAMHDERNQYCALQVLYEEFGQSVQSAKDSAILHSVVIFNSLQTFEDHYSTVLLVS